MSRIEKFQDLIVWQKAIRLFELTVKDIEIFPKNLTARIIAEQLIRSSGSISANIAEGFGRRGHKELTYHLGVAKGSGTETQDWYIKCQKIQFLDEGIVKERIDLLYEIIKMLNAFISRTH